MARTKRKNKPAKSLKDLPLSEVLSPTRSMWNQLHDERLNLATRDMPEAIVDLGTNDHGIYFEGRFEQDVKGKWWMVIIPFEATKDEKGKIISKDRITNYRKAQEVWTSNQS